MTADQIRWTLTPIERSIRPTTVSETACDPVTDYRDLVIRELAASEADLLAQVDELAGELRIRRELLSEAMHQLQSTTAHLQTARATIHALRNERRTVDTGKRAA